MKTWRTNLESTPESTGDERRKFGRLKTDGTDSSMGQVLDISAGGMRVVRKGALPVHEGEKFRVDLQVDKEVIELDVLVCRVRKLGRRKFEFGLEFINLADEDRSRLIRLARTAAQGARAMW